MLGIKIRLELMVRIITDSFSFFMRKLDIINTCFTKPVCIAVSLVGLTIFPEKPFANPQTPSQALPKMFQKQGGLDYYQFKKQQEVVPQLPELQIQKQEDIGITITAKTMIILAPKELQNVINIKKYQEKVIGIPLNVSALYKLALEIEQDFNSNGYPLVRVTLPVQELEAEEATIFLKVIDGFIEKVDLSKVPSAQTLRTFAYLKPLINKKALKLEQMERQLLLASNSAGLSLTSSLMAGEKEGGTRLVIEADHKLISGGVNFDNTQSEQLGRQQGQARAIISSPLGLGETISLFGLARPTIKGMSGAGYEVPIRAGGVSISAPIGSSGLNAGISYMESMTRPGADLETLGLEANMKSATVTASYPIMYKRNAALFSRASISWTDEVQHTNAGGVDEDISHDRITAARIGLSYNGCHAGCLGVDFEASKGLELGSRSNSQVGSGTPLSRSSASTNFTHFRLNSSYTVRPIENFVFKLSAAGQYTLNDLLNSEQTGITGENAVSGLISGAVTGDESWYARGQLNREFKLSKKLMISPYIYTAGGTAYLNQPTATERSATTAKSIGIGFEISSGDEFFFEKTISAKVELSKNWATSNIEDVSDVRLNRQQMLVTMAMRF